MPEAKAIAEDGNGRFLVQTSGDHPRQDPKARGRIVILQTGEASPPLLISSIVVQSHGVDWKPVSDHEGAREAERLIERLGNSEKPV